MNASSLDTLFFNGGIYNIVFVDLYIKPAISVSGTRRHRDLAFKIICDWNSYSIHTHTMKLLILTVFVAVIAMASAGPHWNGGAGNGGASHEDAGNGGAGNGGAGYRGAGYGGVGYRGPAGFTRT
eukprot:GHVR01046591.1.p1 GENE.GHVR01046591.1~~GHVR01046591.1.p1  ORF type:complete len:125 (-),score=15.04 GHVR01046591.1:872-1246(-)